MVAGLDRGGAPWQPGSGGLSRPGLGFRRGPLDGRGGNRRVSPGPGDQCRALRSLQLARRGRFCGQGALGDALCVWRPRGKGCRSQRRRLMTASRSDALVLFGVTGDLAHKMIFPALYALAKRGALKVPVIGVALPKWSLSRLHKRVTESIERSGGVDNQRALHRLLPLLKYVSGDYDDPDTFAAIKSALGSARRPAHYLAIPPSLFETVINGLGAANLAEHARVIVEKPFGRDLASARELNHVARMVFPEDSIFRIDHFLGKEAIMNILYFRFANAFLEP